MKVCFTCKPLFNTASFTQAQNESERLCFWSVARSFVGTARDTFCARVCAHTECECKVFTAHRVYRRGNLAIRPSLVVKWFGSWSTVTRSLFPPPSPLRFLQLQFETSFLVTIVESQTCSNEPQTSTHKVISRCNLLQSSSCNFASSNILQVTNWSVVFSQTQIFPEQKKTRSAVDMAPWKSSLGNTLVVWTRVVGQGSWTTPQCKTASSHHIKLPQGKRLVNGQSFER